MKYLNNELVEYSSKLGLNIPEIQGFRSNVDTQLRVTGLLVLLIISDHKSIWVRSTPRLYNARLCVSVMVSFALITRLSLAYFKRCSFTHDISSHSLAFPYKLLIFRDFNGTGVLTRLVNFPYGLHMTPQLTLHGIVRSIDYVRIISIQEY